MKNLNEEQERAVCHQTGPMMVLAGPGSGKTTVITHRIMYLIEKCKIAENKILVITFTRAAAREMKDRFLCLLHRDSGVRFGTFHSVFFQILKSAYGYQKENLIAETDRYQMIRKLIISHKLHYDGQDEFARNILTEIGLVKSERKDIKAYVSRNMKQDDFILLYQGYNRELRRRNKIDFDDMLVMCYELLKSRSDILATWQKQFQYILIDEFQDINQIQYEIIKMIAGENKNLFVVGDDDQSVYSFRGAKPEIMLGFAEDFPETKIVTLGINYRCRQEIVSASKRLIQHNQNRFEKELASADGEKTKTVHMISVENPKEEYQDICKSIQDFNKTKIPYGNIAILFRTNTEAGDLVRTLMEYHIPFQMRDTIPDFFHHFVVRDVMDYIQVALGDKSRNRFLHIVNKPDRHIPREIFIEEQVDLDMIQRKLPRNQEDMQAFCSFKHDLDRLSGLSPYAAINYIRKAMGYDTYITAHAKRRDIEPQEYLDILDELMDIAKNFPTYARWFQYIEQYQEELANSRREQIKMDDAVTLATMHGAKGLEFDQVFIINAVEGKTPHKKAFKEGNMEEERRMFYVAATRARYGLSIYVPESIHQKKMRISRFVLEMKDAGNI